MTSKKTRKSKNAKHLEAFGRHLEGLIRKKGYSSAYDFWIKKAGDDLSRASLNYILKGEREPRLITLLLLMDLLNVTPDQLFSFVEHRKR